MRISGNSRSEQAARDFATLRSVPSTATQQRLNRIQVPLQEPEALQARRAMPAEAHNAGHLLTRSADLPTAAQTTHSRESTPVSRAREPGTAISYPVIAAPTRSHQITRIPNGMT